MGSKQLQLHATPEDFVEILGLLVDTAGVGIHFCAGSSATGFNSLWVGKGIAAETLADSTQVIASISEIDCVGRNLLELLRSSPGALVLRVPRISDGALQEIDISARSDEESAAEQLKLWGKFLRRLRAQLLSGAHVVNPRTGDSEHYRNAHATRRALQLAKSGVRLIAPGGNIFIYDDA